MQMDIGMLWFDNDTQADLPSKIKNAAEYYLNKYGIHPNVCFVHPSMTPVNILPLINEDNQITEKDCKVFKTDNIEVRTSLTMLPNHFWIGINGSR
jgi:hypothetical protein